MNTMIRPFATLLLLAFLIGGLSACNTIRGVGQDTEAAGKAIEDEANRQSDYDGQPPAP
jgi:predicted small secreted protein